MTQGSSSGELVVRRLDVATYFGMTARYGALSACSPEPNPHFAPGAVQAAAETLVPPGDIVILVAERPDGSWAGLWAFRRVRSLRTGGVAVLQIPVLPLYEVLSSPVLDRDDGAQALAAILSFIARSPDLPSQIMAQNLPLDGPAHLALESILPSRCVKFESWQRGVTLPRPGEDVDTAITRALGTSRKKRQSQRRALEKLGPLTFVQHRNAAALPALESFLTLEAAGWKGKAGTALASIPQDAAWVRALVGHLAAHDAVCIAALMVGDRPAAMGLLIDQDGVTLFLKTAYDEALHKYSPGLHLETEVTRAALASDRMVRFDCGGGDAVDPAAHLWAERRLMGHVFTALDGNPLSRLPILAMKARSGLRRMRNSLRK